MSLRATTAAWVAVSFILVGCASDTLKTDTQADDNAPTLAMVVTVEAGVSDKQLPGLIPVPSPQGDSAQLLLDVGIVTFGTESAAYRLGDESVVNDQQQAVFPLVRKAESRYLPYVLRETLVATGQWGVVRVMPDAEGVSPLMVTGSIQVSNGELLRLKIKAQDSAGRVWVDRIYQQIANQTSYENPQLDPFQPLFDRLSMDLARVKQQLEREQIAQIRDLDQLRYAQQLVPNVFDDYFDQNEQGLYQLLRLPADDDPMLGRIAKLRQYEYFFIDTADEQYLTLFGQMQKTYQQWRQYSRELMVYMRDYEQRQAGEGSGFRRGSLASMNEVYGDYEWFRMQDLHLRELASGFNNEVLPTVLDLDDQVVHLEGNLQDQYHQWRAILAEIFALERGSI